MLQARPRIQRENLATLTSQPQTLTHTLSPNPYNKETYHDATQKGDPNSEGSTLNPPPCGPPQRATL